MSIIRIAGKGTYCCVYYLDQEDFDEIVNADLEAMGASDSRFDLLEANCSAKHVISKGFFANTSDSLAQVTLVCEDKAPVILPKLTLEEMPSHTRGPTSTDPENSQICVVVCDEFQDGVSEVSLGLSDEFDSDALYYVIRAIGHSDDGALWEMTTNQGLFVEDSWEDAHAGNTVTSDHEFYLDAIEYKGVVYELDGLRFENAHSRLWIWRHNTETDCFELDYLTSANVDWGYRGQSGPVVIRS